MTYAHRIRSNQTDITYTHAKNAQRCEIGGTAGEFSCDECAGVTTPGVTSTRCIKHQMCQAIRFAHAAADDLFSAMIPEQCGDSFRHANHSRELSCFCYWR